MLINVDLVERIKPLLGIQYDDLSQDAVIDQVVTMVSQMVLIKLPLAIVVPDELEWIVVEATLKRFNKLGSEGLTTETNEGVQFIYNKDGLLDEYLGYIDEYLLVHPELVTRGRFRMM